ncbi:unnamed protein product, partial [Laminaria digitata]
PPLHWQALGCVIFAVCFLKNPFQDAGNLGILNARWEGEFGDRVTCIGQPISS